jgi:ABC-type Mn2+/Zn2+ transport system ATPase subunit
MFRLKPVEDPAPLRVRHLGAGYPGGFAITDVSFEAEPASVVGLIGPNGSGKSTLLRAIAGVLPARAGEVSLGRRPLRALASSVAYVPQREEVNWGFPVTACDVVSMGRYRRSGWFRGVARGDRLAAEGALARMGLAGMGARHISQFSGGQQQRIFLARAMAQEPRVLILDEPFTGIDAENRAVFHAAIQEFAAAGVIVLVATHDLDEVTTMCSHVCALNRGLVAFGPTESVFTPGILRETFGGQLAIVSAG